MSQWWVEFNAQRWVDLDLFTTKFSDKDATRYICRTQPNPSQNIHVSSNTSSEKVVNKSKPTLCWTQIIKHTDDSNKYHKCHKINKSWIWELWKVVKLEMVEFKEFANKKFSYHPQPVSGLWNREPTL